jgi:hypothetical protein
MKRLFSTLFCCLSVMALLAVMDAGFAVRPCSLLHAATLTVSPDGTITSFQEAVQEVRKLPKDQPIVVEFRAGVYPLAEAVVFTPEDTGTEKAPITYRAADGQNVVFCGGKKITGWKKNNNGIWTTHFVEKPIGQADQ